MKMLDVVQEYRNKLKQNSNDISCLLFALQIPSICSRIEFPKISKNIGKCENGKFYNKKGRAWDANLYKEWLRKNHLYFLDIYSCSMTINEFCDSIYTLRNQVTHEGVLVANGNKFYFIDSADAAMSIDNIVFMPIKRLCEDMFDAAEKTLSKKSVDISLFDNLTLSSNVYSQIYSDILKTYQLFWSNHSEADKDLYMIYKQIIFDK